MPRNGPAWPLTAIVAVQWPLQPILQAPQTHLLKFNIGTNIIMEQRRLFHQIRGDPNKLSNIKSIEHIPWGIYMVGN